MANKLKPNDHNWMRFLSTKVKLGFKDYDNFYLISQGDHEVIVYTYKNKLVDVLGDKSLVGIIKPYFTKVVETVVGETKKPKTKTISTSRMVTLKPGDDSYIDSVLIEKIQNELGLDINSGN